MIKIYNLKEKIIILIMISAIVTITSGCIRTEKIIDDTILVPPAKFESYRFTILSTAGGHVIGSFTSQCNCQIQDSGIAVLIFDNDGFKNWEKSIMFPDNDDYRKNTRSPFYNSMYTISERLDISLHKGNYVIVFTNDKGLGRPSSFEKNVIAKIDIEQLQ